MVSKHAKDVQTHYYTGETLFKHTKLTKRIFKSDNTNGKQSPTQQQ